ncbi:threonine--tRNA ligase 1, cytoplasmic [Lampris incognitus]|uniref:threonine--tRNA ligase 1, cytoplasmic n=1 Tax=Lampris incognitus TaxID=2546036 RepID=UPI0024B4E9BE|nr:threonine--tRNA ligase 1, cytoplasmic [Lampris incognitus]
MVATLLFRFSALRSSAHTTLVRRRRCSKACHLSASALLSCAQANVTHPCRGASASPAGCSLFCTAAGVTTSRVKVSPALSERLGVFEALREKQGERKRAAATEGPLSIQLVSGRTVKGTAGTTTPLLVAQNAHVKGVLVSKVNGELWELGRPLEEDCELQLLGFNSVEGKQTAWRTGACVLGGVLEGVFGADLCREGVSESGLYCDHLLQNGGLSLNHVEERCKELAALRLPLSTLELTKEEVRELFQNSKLRLQLVEEQMNGPTVTVYRCGDSVGVCSGPLLPHTGLLKVFKMLQVSPLTLANHQETSGLMRMIGVAFPGERDKDEWEKEQEEARRRDHRRIGKDQELFFFSDVSPGSCFFLPKGAHIYNTLTDFIKSEYRRRGFDEVVTPTLYSTALWERSGHWEHYSENMFTVTSEGKQTYALKPMNCPAHCLMFEQRVRSWRELPLRWADFGALHRNELSGALGGLTRVRRFCQDDAHIFCTPQQLEEEIVACLDFVKSVYQVFGFTFHCLLSTRPTPCLGEPELWDAAEQQLERSLRQFGERWELNPGDGAFYGPKIDVHIKDAIGRQHQCATIQLDFQLPIKFDLQYVGPDGKSHRPVMVHRAVLGSLERMIAILAENFGGKWPLWLSPAQVMVIPLGGDSESYARQVARRFREAGFMADLEEDKGATLNKKIRAAQLAQYNYIFVVGEKECVSGTVSVRTRTGKQLGRKSTEEVLTSLTQLRDTRSNEEAL